MKNIFAVDDSATVRATLKYMLAKESYNVELAEDGVKALNKLNSYDNRIDAFIFDINMPNMDGIALLKEVRNIPKYKFTPILFLTTESQESKKMEGKRAGATGWIVKPFEPASLISVLKRVI